MISHEVRLIRKQAVVNSVRQILKKKKRAISKQLFSTHSKQTNGKKRNIYLLKTDYSYTVRKRGKLIF